MARTVVIEVVVEQVPEKVDATKMATDIEETLGEYTDGYIQAEVVDDRTEGN